MEVGETYTPQATFTDAADVEYDPDSVHVTVRSPLGALTSPSVDNPAVGVYTATIPLTVRGIWRVWFFGNGPDGEVVILRGYVCAEAVA